jgi:hypothetical protein
LDLVDQGVAGLHTSTESLKDLVIGLSKEASIVLSCALWYAPTYVGLVNFSVSRLDCMGSTAEDSKYVALVGRQWLL